MMASNEEIIVMGMDHFDKATELFRGPILGEDD
jgi:hypothetical protein